MYTIKYKIIFLEFLSLKIFLSGKERARRNLSFHKRFDNARKLVTIHFMRILSLIFFKIIMAFKCKIW